MDDVALLTCPRCGAQGQFHRAEIENKGAGLAMFLLGGMWAALLSQSRNRDMFICDQCHYVFRRETPAEKGMAIVVLSLCVLVLLLALVAWVVHH
jgi:rubredoxin